MIEMRAKMKIDNVEKGENYELLQMTAVCKSEGYDATGDDENNTFAKWTPSASLQMDIRNPSLLGKFEPGQEFYLDFSRGAKALSELRDALVELVGAETVKVLQDMKKTIINGRYLVDEETVAATINAIDTLIETAVE